MANNVKAYLANTVPGSCGLGVLYEFGECFGDEQSRWSDYHRIDKPFVHNGGTGFYVAMFIVGNAICEQAYEALKAQHTIVYESPVRVNSNSDNEVFFCVFDGGEDTHGFDKYSDFYR